MEILAEGNISILSVNISVIRITIYLSIPEIWQAMFSLVFTRGRVGAVALIYTYTYTYTIIHVPVLCLSSNLGYLETGVDGFNYGEGLAPVSDWVIHFDSGTG